MAAKLPDKMPKTPAKGDTAASRKGKPVAARAGKPAGKGATRPAAGKRGPADARVAQITTCIDGFGPDRDQNLRDLAQVVGDIVGAQVVSFRVPRGDDYVITVGWRLG
jgi:hypothetical protein